MKRISLFLVLIFLIPQAHAYCFKYAAQRYHQNALIIESIAIWESSMRPGAVGINRTDDGRILSRDYCLMQINTRNVKALISLGVIQSAQDLLNDPCLCVQAGTWVLAQHLRKCGNTWSCLGSYNAGFRQTPRQEKRRQHYATEIRAVYHRLLARQNPQS